jgi:hypothetical protein
MKKFILPFLSIFAVFCYSPIFSAKEATPSAQDEKEIEETLKYVRSPLFHKEIEDQRKETQDFLQSDELKEAINARNVEKQEWIDWNAIPFAKSEGTPSYCIHRAEVILATLTLSSWIIEYYLYKVMMSEIVRLETKHIIDHSKEIYDSLSRLKKIKKRDINVLEQERTVLKNLLTRPYGWILPAKPSLKMLRVFFFYSISLCMLDTIRSSLKIDDYFFHALFNANNERSFSGILGFFGTMSWVSEKAMLFLGFAPQWSYGTTFYTIRWISGFLFWIRKYEASLITSYLFPYQEKEINTLKELLEPFVKDTLHKNSKKALHRKDSRTVLQNFVEKTIHPSFAGWEFSKTFNTKLIHILFDAGALLTCYKQYQKVYQAMHDMGETMKPKKSSQP